MEQTLEAPRATLAEELSKRIRRFKKQRPHLSSQQIAKRFGVTSSTLNRIENLDIRTPSFDQVLKILKGTGNEEDIVRYVEANYPDAKEAISNQLKSDKYWKRLSPEFVDALKNPETSKILTIVYAKGKVSLDFIQKHFGLEGIKIVKKLQLQKFIRIEQGDIISGNEDSRAPDKKDARDILVTLINNHYNYTGSMEGITENYLSFQIGSVDGKKAMPIITDILREANLKIRELIKSEEMKGPDPVFWSCATDTLIPNNIRFQNSKLKENN